MEHNTSPLGWFITYLAALIAIGVLDGLWLGFVARDFYKAEMGPLMNETIKLGPAAAFYLLYPAGLVFLVVANPSASMAETVLRAAVVGAMAYGAYDMTNLATLKGWTVKLAMADWAWGIFVSAAGGLAIHFTRAWR